MMLRRDPRDTLICRCAVADHLHKGLPPNAWGLQDRLLPAGLQATSACIQHETAECTVSAFVCAPQGVPQAILALSLEPTAIAKAKRLGRDLSIKVTLQPPAAGSSSSSGGSSVVLVGCGEEFFINWPPLLLLDPIGPACSLAIKGRG